MIDDIQQAKNSFFAGFWDRTVEAAKQIKPANDFAKSDHETLMARANYELGRLSENDIENLAKSANANLQALGHHIQFCRAETENARRAACDALKKIALNSAQPSAQMMAAGSLIEMNDHINALTFADGESLEMLALRVQLCLLCHRVDLAEATLARMAQLDEDSPLFKLAAAWTSLAVGSSQEAYLTMDDLRSFKGEELDSDSISRSSAVILNGMAVANMQRGQWGDALQDLLRQKELTTAKSAYEETAQANLVACYAHLRQIDKMEECIAELRTCRPGHAMLKKLKALDLAIEKFQKVTAA